MPVTPKLSLPFPGVRQSDPANYGPIHPTPDCRPESLMDPKLWCWIHNFVALRYGQRHMDRKRLAWMECPRLDLRPRASRAVALRIARRVAATLIYLILPFDFVPKNSSMAMEIFR